MSAKRYVKGVHSQNGDTIQVLPPSITNNQKVTLGASTARVALGAGVVFRFAATQDCYLEFGGASVDATTSSMYFPAGVETFVVPDSVTHVAYINNGTAGIMTITAMGDS